MNALGLFLALHVLCVKFLESYLAKKVRFNGSALIVTIPIIITVAVSIRRTALHSFWGLQSPSWITDL